MYKTGSSSIQKTLYTSRSNLRSICYPDFNRYNHSNIIKQAFGYTSSVSAEEKAVALESFRDILRYNAEINHDIIISDESLTASSFNKLKDLYSTLNNYSDEIIAVGYIRSPKAYIESYFQESLKTLNVTTFDIKKRFPFYKNHFEKFDRIFGKANVQFWKFDPCGFKNGCVVTDFCSRMNIAINPADIIRINEGLSLGAASLLYAFSKYREQFNYSEVRLGLLINLLSQLQGKKLRFSSKLISPLLEENHHQIEWMERRMGASLAEDITIYDEYAISTESALLTFEPATLNWLAEQLGGDYINRWNAKMTISEIAEWIYHLCLMLKKKSK